MEAVKPSPISGDSALPPGVSRWHQKKLRDPGHHGTVEEDSSFLVRNDDFLTILGPCPRLEKVVETDAHEGLVYYPNDNSLFFTTTGDFKSGSHPPTKWQVKKICLDTQQVTTFIEKTTYANGMTLDLQGNLLICQQGNRECPGYIEEIKLDSGVPANIADNWFGRPFNGPNDIVVKTDGSIWFTDPDYPSDQGFRGQPKFKNYLFRIGTDGIVDVVCEGFHKPNGLAFSPDESKLYVTDTGYLDGFPQEDKNLAHNITVFDVVNGRQLSDRRLFASICAFDGSDLGMPDGIKVDTDGRVYVASSDGVHVISDEGIVLGLIRIPNAVTIGFGGPALDTLYIFNDSVVQSVKLNATGAGLYYAGHYNNVPFYTSPCRVTTKQNSPGDSAMEP